MKNTITLITICAMLCSCAGYEPRTPWGKKALAWWQEPTTQEKVEAAKELAVSFAVGAALAALSSYAGTGHVDFTKIAVAGGVSTLYTGASKIRQLQGTYQVFDPEATAQLLQEGGATKETAQKLADQLVKNAQGLIDAKIAQNGPFATTEDLTNAMDEAAELNAVALDKAAAIVQTATTNP